MNVGPESCTALVVLVVYIDYLAKKKNITEYKAPVMFSISAETEGEICTKLLTTYTPPI